MKYSNQAQNLGLGQLERQRLSELLRNTKVAITVIQAAKVWGMDRSQAAKILSSYNKKGWLKRIARGVYISVPLSSKSPDVVPEEPFAVAEKLFSPCYIGGVNAANYWDLTEQIFRSITVMTEKLVTNRTQEIAGIEYQLHTLKPEYFFGLKSVWLSDVKVKISDPTRTLVDMLMFPKFCGGIRFIEDVLINYFNSDYKDSDLFIDYLKTANNGAAVKRLGFLLEVNFPDETKLIDFCMKNLTAGYIKLAPSLDCPRLISRWRLWVPERWKGKLNDK